MKILILGSRDWTNYNDLMRYMTILIQDATETFPEDKTIIFVHSGSKGAENMATEYIGKTEKFLRQKGIKVKEQIFRQDSQPSINDFKMMEAGADAAIVFTTDCQRTRSGIKLLKEFGIPSVVYAE